MCGDVFVNTPWTISIEVVRHGPPGLEMQYRHQCMSDSDLGRDCLVSTMQENAVMVECKASGRLNRC